MKKVRERIAFLIAPWLRPRCETPTVIVFDHTKGTVATDNVTATYIPWKVTS